MNGEYFSNSNHDFTQSFQDEEYPWHCRCEDQRPEAAMDESSSSSSFPTPFVSPDPSSIDPIYSPFSQHHPPFRSVHPAAFTRPSMAPPITATSRSKTATTTTTTSSSDSESFKARVENALIRDSQLLHSYTQPRAVLEQMNDWGIGTLLPGADLSNSDTEFFESVD